MGSTWDKVLKDSDMVPPHSKSVLRATTKKSSNLLKTISGFNYGVSRDDRIDKQKSGNHSFDFGKSSSRCIRSSAMQVLNNKHDSSFCSNNNNV